MKEEKKHVGRPKLADTKLKKQSIIIIEICIIAIIVLLFCALYSSKNNMSRLSGKYSSTAYPILHGKRMLMYGTSIGKGTKSYKTYSLSWGLKKTERTPFIKIIAINNDMKFSKKDNKSEGGCGGVYAPDGKSPGYFNYILKLKKRKIKKYDFLIIEGFANDSENENENIDVFRKEFDKALKHLKKYKKSSAKIIVVLTPKLPASYGQKMIDRQWYFWGAAESIAHKNNVNLCDTYNVDAKYKVGNGDHPSIEGHENMAEVVQECMVNAKFY